MNRAGILHRADSEYSFLGDDGRCTLLLKAAKGDLSEAVVFVDDRYDLPGEKREWRSLRMELVHEDEVHAFFRAAFRPPYTRLSYYFFLTGRDGTAAYYYQDGFSDTYSWGRQRLFHLPYLHACDAPRVPRWLKESVMYQLFPDSFANGPRSLEPRPQKHVTDAGVPVESRLGGTLRGILQSLDHLSELGITLLYLNPVFTAGAYHKYDTLDYYRVDPCLGTNEELAELVDACHRRGIRVMLDLVFNQSSDQFYAFRDVKERGAASPYADWYAVREFPVRGGPRPNYETFAFYDVMPKYNFECPELVDYLIDIGRYWLREYGVDGYRLDVANEMPHAFWTRFRREMEAVRPDVALIGEVWHDAASWLGRDGFHGVMNYPLLYAVWEFFALDSLNAAQFTQAVGRLALAYRRDNVEAMMNFLDSHDVARFLTIAGARPERQRLAAAFLFTCAGIPCVYYGDERCLEGTDIDDSRRPMPWTADEPAAAMEAWYKKLIRLRREKPALVYGELRPLPPDAAGGVAGFVRETEEQTLLCLFNRSGQRRTVRVLAGGTAYADRLGDGRYETAGGYLEVLLEPYGACVLEEGGV